MKCQVIMAVGPSLKNISGRFTGVPVTPKQMVAAGALEPDSSYKGIKIYSAGLTPTPAKSFNDLPVTNLQKQAILAIFGKRPKFEKKL